VKPENAEIAGTAAIAATAASTTAVAHDSQAKCRGRRPTPQMRERILRSASELFGRKEFHRVLTDEVAALAGVGKGSIYRQFGSKEALYAAVVIDGFTSLRGEIRAAIGGGDLRADLTALVSRAVGFFWNRREFFTLLRDPTALPPEQAKRYLAERDKLSRLVTRVLGDGVRRGAMRADLDTRVAAESLLGMMRGINRYCRDFTTPDQAVATVVTLFMSGCAPRPDAPRESQTTAGR
jgi:AcrR family transcriptional regulator